MITENFVTIVYGVDRWTTRRFCPVFKTKVFIYQAIASALALLQRQKPDIPTEDWKVLHAVKPTDTDGWRQGLCPAD